MQQQIQQLFDTVTQDDEARELLEENPLTQDIIFKIDGADDVLATLEPHSADVSVVNSPEEYDLFTTTVLELDRQALDALLRGDYLSEYYLEGDLQIKGLPSVKILLGQLFRINHKQQSDKR